MKTKSISLKKISIIFLFLLPLLFITDRVYSSTLEEIDEFSLDDMGVVGKH